MAAPRARVRNVFLRCLGIVFVVAFASLAVQARVLWGSRGLLPACGIADAAGPTLFRFRCDDTALVAFDPSAHAAPARRTARPMRESSAWRG